MYIICMTVAMLKIKNRANLVKKSLRYNSLYYLLLFFCNYGWFLVVSRVFSGCFIAF